MIVIIIMILIHKSREKKTETCSIRKGKYITGHMAYFDKFLNALLPHAPSNTDLREL